MSRRFRPLVVLPYLSVALLVGVALLGELPSLPQVTTNGCIIGGASAVGGVAVDPSGVLVNVDRSQRERLRQQSAAALEQAGDDLSTPNELRKVSLRRLEAAVADLHNKGLPLSDEMKLMAGLQRIRYVFVYPEQNDILLVGYGEGWKLDEMGAVVGNTTGQPVLALEDLIVALRSAETASRGGVSCSIDPSPEGIERLRQLVGTLQTIGNPQATSRAIEQALGPQVISVNGVPPTSRFARVMVAADYRMKRIGMGLEPSPVSGLPSYLQLIGPGSRGMSAMAPRWWLVPNYEPLLTDDEGLAWELRGSGVKCLTEETFFGQGGRAAQTGQASPEALRWAEAMTEKYDELARRDAVFGELRNCMDLAVVAALLVKERLLARAGLSLPLLIDPDVVPLSELSAPRQVASQASAVKKGRNWVISASGGVQIDAWRIVARQEKNAAALRSARPAAPPADDPRWWWD